MAARGEDPTVRDEQHPDDDHPLTLGAGRSARRDLARFHARRLGYLADVPSTPPRPPRPHDVDPTPDLLSEPGQGSGEAASSESTVTVLVALVANAVIAVAKSGAAVVTGSASMLAEAAHSWADTGNEIFLLIADRRSRRAPDASHPAGYGREAYVWSMFAALGLFVAGGAVSVTRGIQELLSPEPAQDFVVGYVVLGIAFLFEGISFVRALRQARPEAEYLGRDILDHVLASSDPTLRAVVFEDGAALVGVLLAGGGLALHQATGSTVFDALGSILVGVVLGVVALLLVHRNRQFLVGEQVDERIRSATISVICDLPDVDRLTYLHLEVVGPRRIRIVGDVDLVGDAPEPDVAVTLRSLEATLCTSPVVVAATLSLSAPDEPSLTP